MTTQPIAWTSSKKEIYSAYKEILKKYEDAIANPMPKAQQVRENEQKSDLTKRTNQLTPEALIEGIGRMKASVSKTLDDVSQQIVSQVDTLRDLQKASQIAQSDLEKLTDAKVLAQGIEQWLADHMQQKQDMENDLAEEKAELEAEIAEMREKWQLEEAERKQARKEEELLLKKSRERDEQEYQYTVSLQRKKDEDNWEEKKASFERETRLKQNALDDELKAKRQEIEAELNDIARWKEIALTWEEKLASELAKREKEVTEKLDREYKYSSELHQQKSSSDLKLAQVQIQNLENYIAKQETRIEELATKLDQATGRVQEIATKAVDSAAGAGAFSAVNRIAMEQAKQPRSSNSENSNRS